MSKLGPDTIVRQSPDVTCREISGQTVILTPHNGSVHELDDLGGYIWSLCADPVSIGTITDQIVSQYDVERAAAEEDLTSFIGQMIELGAVSEG